MNKVHKLICFYGVLFLFLLPAAILPLFKPYVSGTADGIGHRFRLVSFYNSLKDGNIRPRWAGEAAQGFGAPIFLFNYPLPYYIASFFHFLGFSINTSGQLLAATSLFLSGFFMFLAVRRLIEGVEGLGGIEGLEGSGRWGGLVAAVVYTYAPYHLQMTYLYDAWGEELAFVFPPLILYLAIRVIGEIGEIRDFFLLVFVWFLFILSHNVSAVMFTPVILLLGLVMGYKRPGLAVPQGLALFKAFVLAVLISSFFWLPALVLQNKMKYPQFLASEGAMRGSFFKSFSFQLETAVRVIKEGTTHYLDFTVGLPILLVALIGLISLIRSKKEFMVHSSWFIVLLLFSLYLTTYRSNWLWNLPIVSFPLSFILYPFRFLFAVSFIGALLAGFLIGNIREIWARGMIGGVLIIFSLIQGLPYTKPAVDSFPFPDSYFSSKQTVTSAPLTRKNMLIKEFLPAGASLEFLQNEETKTSGRDELLIIRGNGKITGIKSKSEEISATIDAKTDADLLLNRFYFPNWQAEIDGRRQEIIADEEGRMKIRVDEGIHDLKLVFGVSRIERISYVLSLVGIIILIGVHHFHARA